MVKQLLAISAFLCASISLSAQTWNFSNFELKNHEATTTIDGLTIHASSSAKINVTANNKTYDDVQYTQRLQFGGGATWDDAELPVSRVISFPVTGNTTISIIATTSNNDDDRVMVCSAGTKSNEVGKIDMAAGQLVKLTFNYVGGATNIHLYSASGGINLYNLEAVPADGTGIQDATINKEVISTEYYNVVGVRTNQAEKGLNMVKRTMSDGSVSVEKVYIP